MAATLNVAVIGAGVAGLSAARQLKKNGHRVIVYEKSDRLGGIWVYDPRVESDPLCRDPNREIIHGSLYKSLRTNLPRHLMGFSDYPFRVAKNGHVNNFPGHAEVLKFLDEFAAEFELAGLIRFNTEVVRVEQVEGCRNGEKWVVESRKTSQLSSEEEVFDAVVVCNGHYTQPRLAEFPGMEKWPGKQSHSHNYRDPEPYRNLVVVLIGHSASAHDISREIALVAKEVHLSTRSKDVKLFKFDDYQNIWHHSKIDHVDENGEVVFEDGESIHADAILHCTGFKYEFPFLNTNGVVNVDDNRVGPLYKHVFPPELAPRLSFIGIPYRVIVFQMLELQAKWIAQVLSGNALLPSREEMLADVEAHYRQLEENGIPKHHTHLLCNYDMEYLDFLAVQAGVPPVDPELKEMFNNLFKFAYKHGFNSASRDLWDENWRPEE
nr:flavin-containing monooxygenase FMO GS-OX5-like isoform X1 [Ipomoea batatas]